jgi:prepilin-type N-terminal cleavage/methylation domain-containing protein
MERIAGHRERGVTLVEMMVTLAILSILSVALAGAIRDNAPSSRLDGHSREVVADIQLARQRAVTEGRTCTVSFDRAAGTYTVWVDYDNNGLLTDPPAAGQPVEIKLTRTLQEGIAFDYLPAVEAPPDSHHPGAVVDASLANELVFDSRGWCRALDGGTPGDVYLVNDPPEGDRRMMGITVRSSTGRARLWTLARGTVNDWS